MRSCGNCIYKDLKITEEPCDSCYFMCNWEEDKEEEDNDNFKK